MSTVDRTTVTYRYLRVGLAVLPCALGASVVVEMVRTGCVLDSISASWYTPAQDVFVGTLTAIGACLVIVKGSTSAEDVLLNLAGMMAPVVAFAPTPFVPQCGVVGSRDVQPAITNGVVSLVVASLVVLVAAVVVGVRTRTPQPTPVFRIGRLVGVAVAVVGVLVFALDRSLFDRAAHYTAAVTLFGCIIAVALITSRTTRSRWVNAYSTIAVLMLLTLPAGLAAAFLVHWSRTVLAVEAALVVLFVAFWLVETEEHWREG